MPSGAPSPAARGPAPFGHGGLPAGRRGAERPGGHAGVWWSCPLLLHVPWIMRNLGLPESGVEESESVVCVVERLVFTILNRS